MLELHPKKIDLSLERINKLLKKLDHPEKKLAPIIHVAGTNGKGSVIAFLRSILESAGYRVHTYTSPHLIQFNERIRIAVASGKSKFINEDLLVSILDECEFTNNGAPITFFEITTAAAFVAFSRVPSDIILLEVGLGGRLDATNVVKNPLVTVITPIGIDHTDYLGNTMESITKEKAGILKKSVPAVIGKQNALSEKIIENCALNNRSPVYLNNRDWSIKINDSSTFNIKTLYNDLEIFIPKLKGIHQIYNAGHAIACLDHINLTIDESAIHNGVSKVKWPGRLQRILQGSLLKKLPKGSELWVDGAHNPAGATVVAKSMEDMSSEDSITKPLVLILGLVQTKDVQSFLTQFSDIAIKLVAVPASDKHSSTDPKIIVDIGNSLGIESIYAINITRGVDLIKETIGDQSKPRVLICGSLYLAGEALTLSGLSIT